MTGICYCRSLMWKISSSREGNDRPFIFWGGLMSKLEISSSQQLKSSDPFRLSSQASCKYPRWATLFYEIEGCSLNAACTQLSCCGVRLSQSKKTVLLVPIITNENQPSLKGGCLNPHTLHAPGCVRSQLEYARRNIPLH